MYHTQFRLKILTIKSSTCVLSYFPNMNRLPTLNHQKCFMFRNNNNIIVHKLYVYKQNKFLEKPNNYFPLKNWTACGAVEQGKWVTILCILYSVYIEGNSPRSFVDLVLVQDHPASARFGNVLLYACIVIFSARSFVLFFSHIGQMSGNSNFIHKFQFGYWIFSYIRAFLFQGLYSSIVNFLAFATHRQTIVSHESIRFPYYICLHNACKQLFILSNNKYFFHTQVRLGFKYMHT